MVTQHGVGFTGSSLPIHEYSPISALTQELSYYLSAALFIDMFIGMHRTKSMVIYKLVSVGSLYCCSQHRCIFLLVFWQIERCIDIDILCECRDWKGRQYFIILMVDFPHLLVFKKMQQRAHSDCHFYVSAGLLWAIQCQGTCTYVGN